MLRGEVMLINKNGSGAASAEAMGYERYIHDKGSIQPGNTQDPTEQFREFASELGYSLPNRIVPDGKVHRFSTNGKRGDDAGTYVLHVDGVPNGWVQNWREGSPKHDWKPGRTNSAAPSLASSSGVKTHRADDDGSLPAKFARIWEETTPAKDDHPYLARKGVKPHGLRQGSDGRLVIPLWDGGICAGIQFIDNTGNKKYEKETNKKGLYYMIGEPRGARTLCIAEGFATAASIHEETGHPCAVSFDAGNLPPVAEALSASYPGVKIIVCADDDWKTENNPGRTKAREAAALIGAWLAVPDFGTDRLEKETDFNDLHQAYEDAVFHWIAKATFIEKEARSDWPELQELATSIDRQEYPVNVLPDTIRAAVIEVQRDAQAPMPMVAMAAFGALSAGLQHLADVARDTRLKGPTSLWLMAFADSGERKSALDETFSKGIREFQARKAREMKPEIEAAKRNVASWEAKQAGHLDAIKKAARLGQASGKAEKSLKELGPKPSSPRVPHIMRGDDTSENLLYSLAHEWPSVAVLNSEAGAFFGAHAMGPEKIMATLGQKNALWGGEEHHVGRRTSESFTVRGARYTLGLQIQPIVIRQFCDKQGALARGIGFWARFLIAEPESTQGTRFRKLSKEKTAFPALDAFSAKLSTRLEIETRWNEEGTGLDPVVIELSTDGEETWRNAYNGIEERLGSDGDYSEIRDVASKAAENIARMAALFHVFEHGLDGDISADHIDRATLIVKWHLNEARRFFFETALTPEERDVAKLEEWLVKACRDNGSNIVSRREAQRGVLRNGGGRLKAALSTLEKHGRIKQVNTGKRKDIEMHPELLKGDASCPF